jgi:hypothetical protein
LNALRSLIPRRGSAAGFASLRWAALPITDRRWTAPLSAIALGMGLFIGVAIGPGISSTLGTTPLLVVAAADDANPTSSSPASAGEAAPPALGSPVANTPVPHSNAAIPAPTTSVAPIPTTVPVAPTTTTPTTDTTKTNDTSDETTTTPDDTTDELVFKGTVIHVNPLASSYVVTTGKGQMNAVHAKRLPDPGAKLEVPVRELANGTYAEDGKETKTGTAHSARLQGLVTFADPATGAYTLSRKGASIVVHPNSGSQPPPAPPKVGTQLTVSAKLGPRPDEVVNAPPPPAPEPPPTTTTTTTTATTTTTPVPPTSRLATDCGTPPAPPDPPDTILTETSRKIDIDFLGYSDFEGIVQGVCASTEELVLSADDLRESGADITLPLGEDTGIDLGSISPGDVVDASGTIDADTGALALTGISNDEGIKRADDADLKQGDQAS